MNNTYTNPEEICPACSGARIQINKDGLRVQCPMCGGQGKFRTYEQPYYECVSVNTPTDTIKYQIFQ